MSVARDREARGDELVQHVLERDDSEHGELPQRLLEAFQTGYPIQRLAPLLRHTEFTIVTDALWLARNLVPSVTAVAEDLVALLLDERAACREGAADVILASAIDAPDVLARALSLVRHPDPLARRRGFELALVADEVKLSAVLPLVDPQVRRALEQSGLLGPFDDWRRRRGMVERAIDHDQVVHQGLGTAAAARIGDRELLARARKSHDPGVASFAAAELRYLIDAQPATAHP